MRGRASAGELVRGGIHLAVLSALAIAQPVLDILGKNPAFFAIRGSTATEIVLFALVLTLGLPAVLLLVEMLAGAVDRRLARAVHLVFVAALAGLLALYALTETDMLDDGAALAAAAVAAAGAAAVYALAGAARMFLSVLAPVPLVFAALFLFTSPVSDLVFAEEPEARAAPPVASRTPVVLIVYDELSTVSLMDARQRIDAERYPGFASLAADSTWYRNATTSYWLSEVAVPSILTGLDPVPGRLPVASAWPNNLFTLLGRSYRMRVVETLTRLCPRSICRETQDAETAAVPNTVRSFASDVGTVYLHLLLPEPYADRLPPIDDAWGNFGQDRQAEREAERRGEGDLEPCGRNTCQFRDLIDRSTRPTLWFVHSLLPHVPYVYLPSGRRYAVDARPLRGIDNGRWLDAWAMRQGQQRYLLQLAYTDRALALALRRLRETGVYDRALVIVTADHGVGFRARDHRRLPTPGNLDEIAFVPLFVKLPGQRAGRIDDAPARNVDVLPTIARVLGLPLRWRTHGRPLVGRRPAGDATVTVLKQDGSRVSAPLSRLVGRRARALETQVATFGTGSLDRVFRIGPHRELVGRQVAALPVLPARATSVELDGRTLLDSVDRAAGFVPTFIEGRVRPAGTRADLVVALNGRVAAVTRTFDQHGQTRFSAMVPEDALRSGRNDVEVFAVEASGGDVRLVRLRGSDLRFSLVSGGAAIRVGARTVRVRAGSLRGLVRARRGETGWTFSGFAAEARTNRRVDTIVVFAGERAVYSGRAENLKPHAVLGQPELGRTGFEFELPRSLLPAPGTGRVRVYALRDGTAAQLRAAAGFPWR